MTILNKGKVVVYVDYHNPCCDYGQYRNEYKSHEQLLKERSKIVTLYLVDKDKLKDCWGDDWNDSPSCANSGTPYDHDKYPEIIKIDIKLGESIFTDNSKGDPK